MCRARGLGAMYQQFYEGSNIASSHLQVHCGLFGTEARLVCSCRYGACFSVWRAFRMAEEWCLWAEYSMKLDLQIRIGRRDATCQEVHTPWRFKVLLLLVPNLSAHIYLSTDKLPKSFRRLQPPTRRLCKAIMTNAC